MKFKPKPTYFTRQDLELILKFDRLLEVELIRIQKDIDYKRALQLSKEMKKTLDFATFFADFKASRSK